MKKSSRSRTTKLLVLLGVIAAPFAFADNDPNQLLSFKKIFIEPVHDNVDGAFRAPVEQSYKEVFERNQRFEAVADRVAADSVLKTTVDKKTSGTDIEITLVVTGTGEVFSSDRTSVPATVGGRETGAAVKQLLKTALKRVPFYGTVTGRDDKQLTFDIGEANGLKRGDVIQVSRVDNIKRHPLLKSIVDVQMVPVGSAELDQVESSIAFGHVHDEIAGEHIQRLHKVTAIEARAPEPKKTATDPSATGETLVYEAETEEPDRPEVGNVGLGVFLGAFSSTSSRNAGTTNFSGSAFSPGFRLTSEIWLTKRWFVDLLLGASTMSYAQTNTALANPPSATGNTSSTRTFGFDFGYKYLPTGSIHGPQATVKLGYYSFTWDTAVQSASLLSPKSYSGLNLGVGGVLPMSERVWGFALNVNVLLFPAMDEEGFRTGVDPSSTAVNFYLGAYRFLSNRIALRAGFQFDIYSADFGDGASASSTNQTAIGFLPSLVYYF